MDLLSLNPTHNASTISSTACKLPNLTTFALEKSTKGRNEKCIPNNFWSINPPSPLSSCYSWCPRDFCLPFLVRLLHTWVDKYTLSHRSKIDKTSRSLVSDQKYAQVSGSKNLVEYTCKFRENVLYYNVASPWTLLHNIVLKSIGIMILDQQNVKSKICHEVACSKAHKPDADRRRQHHQSRLSNVSL
jgi:hypothetical protein